MKWKTRVQYESKPLPGPHTIEIAWDGKPGQLIRVTVEEEVSECCERWRQALCFTGGHGRWDELIGPVIYCPTCREKL
jgi:hypothetical protein